MLLYQGTSADGCPVRITTAGDSVRLYRNGVLHTQWHQKQPIRGTVWDLLAMPALFDGPQSAPRTALLLGIGGGAVLHFWHHFLPQLQVTAVDIDADNITYAQRYFGLKQLPNCTIHHADAQQFLRRQRKRYDLIVEDCFDPSHHAVRRALPLTETWCGRLAAALSTRGTLVCNNGDAAMQRRCALVANEAFARGHGFTSAWSLSVPGYLNRSGVFRRQPMPALSLKQQLTQWQQWQHGPALLRPLFYRRQLW